MTQPGEPRSDGPDADMAFEAEILDAIPDGVVVLDLDARITFWNVGAETIFGVRAATAAGRTLGEVLTRERTIGREPLFAAIEDGTAWEGDLELLDADGSRRVVEIMAYAPRPAPGRSARILLAWDVTRLRATSEDAGRVAAIVEQADDAIYTIDRDGRVLTWNAGAERLTGFSTAWQIGRLGPFAESAEVKAEFRRRAFEDGEAFKVPDATIRHADGGLIPVDLAVSPVRGLGGRVVAMSVVARDARPRLAAERDLRFRDALLGAIDDAVVATDADDRLVFWSPGAERLLGVAAADALGHRLAELVPFRFPAEAEREARRALRAGEPFRVDAVYTRPDGTTFTGDISVSTMTAEDGSVATLAVIRDVTAVRRAAADSARLAAVVEGAGDIIVGSGLDGVVSSWNPAAERALGYTAREMIGRTIATYIVPEHLPQAFELRRRLTEGGAASAAAEFTYVARDGTLFPVWVVIAPIRDAGGRIVGISAVGHDLRTRKALEDQVRQAQKLEAVARLAGGIAHDFNNLLTAITGYASLLEGELPTDGPAASDIAQIMEAADRAAELTRSLLAFSRGKPREPRLVRLDDVLRSAGPMLRRLLPERVELVLEPASGVTVLADPTELELVLVNLAINGSDAMPAGGSLEIRAARVDLDQAFADAHLGVHPGVHGELLVRDSGAGMTEDVRDHLFEPFFTTKPDRGTGLGLTTVHAFVEQAGGTIWVDSERGRGSTFRVLLPVAAEPAPSEPLAERPSLLSRAPGGTERILLVEDDAQVRALSSTILGRAGYRLTVIGDPRDALEVDPTSVDLLVSDVIMPNLEGTEVARGLRARRPDLPVLFMSGFTDRADASDLAEHSSQPLLAKPFGPADLLHAVRRALDEGSDGADRG